MMQYMRDKLRKSLIKHEDLRLFPYVDTVGKITIGIGYNLSDRGLPLSWIDNQFQDDINEIYKSLSGYFWFNYLNEDRKIALIDMAFMGVTKFLEFKNMIKYLKADDWEKAAQEILNSEWAKEVKSGRADAIANAIRTGVYNV